MKKSVLKAIIREVIEEVQLSEWNTPDGRKPKSAQPKAKKAKANTIRRNTTPKKKPSSNSK